MLNFILRKKNAFIVLLCFLFLVAAVLYISLTISKNKNNTIECIGENGYIEYVEFNVSYEALLDTMNIDIGSHCDDIKINWIDLLAYYASKNNGIFTNYTLSSLDDIVNRLKNGESIDKITEGLKSFSYYKEAYSAALSGLLGEYIENNSGEIKYGLIGFCPIAANFPFEDYDDFGAIRSYGYTRKHLGHDMLASVGTPVIAVESGTVEALGWNQYGGWRIGIRSNDNKRYYYYAHLRQNRPYSEGMYEGKEVLAGDVIGYVGRTGYSIEENVNNIETSHLHFGLELIFDESQKECDNEIWIDVYNIVKLLKGNKSEVYRVSETKEFYRKNNFNIIS